MTPKEKALELFNEYAKAHALNVVDNIIDAINWTTESEEQLKFWEEVKQELDKM